MRRVLLVCLALLAGCGQDSGGDKTIVATLGDSITAGSPGWDPDPVLREQLDAHNPASQWQHWAQAELGDEYELRNCGVPGDRTDEMAERLDDCVAGADVVVLQGGTNDLIQRRRPAEVAANLRAMADRATDRDVPVFVANVLPVNVDRPWLERRIRRLNELVDELAPEEGAEVIDFFSLLEDPRRPGRILPKWTAEGLHPSVAGYRRLGEAVARQLRAR